MHTTAPVNASLTDPGLAIPVDASNGPHMGQGLGNVRCFYSPLLHNTFSEWYSSVSDWITFLKPLPKEGENVITLRRETHVALNIHFDRLPREPPIGCRGIKIPATGGVRNYSEPTGETLLEFRIHVYGATGQLYNTACANCERREGKRKGTPSLIDFHASQDTIAAKDGKIRVDFSFCCYPKCRQEDHYL